MFNRTRLATTVAAVALVASACSPSGPAGAAIGPEPSAAPIAAPAAQVPPPAQAAPAAMDHSHAGMTGHDCDAHEGDASRKPEHCAAMALTDPAAATATASTGLWSDPATWGGVVPPADARIHIPEGATVTVDGEFGDKIEALRIDGTLEFATDRSTLLRVDTLVSSPTGRLVMGTPETPVAADVVARIMVVDDGPIDPTEDPTALGRGLVLHGSTTINGAAKTPFLESAAAPMAGETTLTLTAAPQGWLPGDEIVVAGTGADGSGDEEATIAGVSGRVVTLTEPLTYDHPGPKPDLNVHVANLTRNVVIESEADEVANRGHVMFMHTTDAQVANAGFYRMGRTDKKVELLDRIVDNGIANVCVSTDFQENVRGRYSVHFHRAGVLGTPAASVTGSVATDNPGWAYVNHSSNVDFDGNVAYNVDGAAFNTEAGDEIGSFTNNISIKTHGNGGSPVERQGTQDFGHAGDGFWFQGSTIQIEGNIAAGATGAGFVFYTESLVEPHAGRVWVPAANLPFDTGGLEQVPVVQVPILDFRNNEAYGSVIGARSYYHRTDITLGLDEATAIYPRILGFPQSRIEDLTLWGNETGWMSNYTVDTVFSNLRIVGTEGKGIGFDASNVYNRGVHRYEGFDVSGYGIGIHVSLAGDVTVDGGTFANAEHNIYVPEPRQVERRVLVTGSPTFSGPGTEVAADASLERLVDSDEEWFLLTDRIILDYGPYAGSQLFYEEQASDKVLFASQPRDLVPDDPSLEVGDEYIGRTNAQLAAEFGTSFGGTFPTTDARQVSGFVGLVGSPAPDPGPMPTAEEQRNQDIQGDLEDIEELGDLGSGDGFNQTVAVPNCEEYVDEFLGDEEEIEELLAECENLGPDADPELVEECEYLLEESDGGNEEGDETPLTEDEIRAEIAELDAEELAELAYECEEAREAGYLDEEEELATACAILEETTGG